MLILSTVENKILFHAVLDKFSDLLCGSFVVFLVIPFSFELFLLIAISILDSSLKYFLLLFGTSFVIFIILDSFSILSKFTSSLSDSFFSLL